MRKSTIALGLVAWLLIPFAALAQAAQPTFPQRAAFIASVSGQANTAAAHVLAVEAGASRAVRLLRVCVTNPGAQTTPGFRVLLLERTTAAGSGGVVTAEAAGASSAALARTHGGVGAFSGIVRALPSALGSQGATLAVLPIWVPGAVAFAQPVCLDFGGIYDRPPRIPAGTANGIALRDAGAVGATGLAAFVVFAEE
jgi:hypothetical protein